MFYLLYINGLLIFSAKTAAIFAGYVRRNGNAQFRFAACRGQVKRVVRFPNPGIYHFTDRSEISDGTVAGKGLAAKRREGIYCIGMS